jgi:hypothetical protein
MSDSLIFRLSKFKTNVVLLFAILYAFCDRRAHAV